MSKKKTRSLKGYDISDYNYTPGFMTDDEIKDMYRKLAFHMKVKYGMYHEEVIHRTIIRGLHKASMYDPTKASKLVWFQSILYFYWIQERAPEYNHSDTDISLSSSLSKSDPDFTLIETIDNKEDDWKEFGEDEEEDFTPKVVGFIQGLFDQGLYPFLKLRAEGLTYDQIKVKTGLSNPTITGRLHTERVHLKEKILAIKEGNEVLSLRVPITKWTFGKYKYNKKEPKEHINRVCTICSKSFVYTGCLMNFCTYECRGAAESIRVNNRLRPKVDGKDGRRNNGRPKKNKVENDGNI